MDGWGMIRGDDESTTFHNGNRLPWDFSSRSSTALTSSFKFKYNMDAAVRNFIQLTGWILVWAWMDSIDVKLIWWWMMGTHLKGDIHHHHLHCCCSLSKSKSAARISLLEPLKSSVFQSIKALMKQGNLMDDSALDLLSGRQHAIHCYNTSINQLQFLQLNSLLNCLHYRHHHQSINQFIQVSYKNPLFDTKNNTHPSLCPCF